MSNLSDKELDRLSREAADFYEPDPSTLSWTRLEQKLIEQMPERPPDGIGVGRIKPYVWVPAVVLLTGISFYFIKNFQYSKHFTRTINPVSQSVSSSSAASGGSGRTIENTYQSDSLSNAAHIMAPGIQNASAANQKEAVANAGINPVPGTMEDPTVVNLRKHSSRGVKTTIPATRTTLGSFTFKETPVSNRSHDPGRNYVSTAGSSSITGSTSNKATAAGPADENGNTRNPVVTGTTNVGQAPAGILREKNTLLLPVLASSGRGLGQVEANDSLLKHSVQSGSPIPYRSVHVNRSLNFGLAFGPDYTDGGGIANDELSNNIGITVGYYLTSRISLNSGIFYTNKFYWSPGNERRDRTPYPQGSNSITNAALPPVENVNGSCNMYEIPLTLRFDFAKNEKTKFFVNGGLSSYFMMKQTYIYFFHSGGRPLAWKQSDNQQVNYWLGVGDLSFGLETDMGKGFSFQAEPFFRIPLREMGLQNLKLTSYGFLLSFRYAPVLSRIKK